MTERWTFERLIQGFIQTLETVADDVSGIEREPSRGGIDVVLNAQFGKVPLRLFVEVKRSAYPRDVRDAAFQLKRYLPDFAMDRGAIAVLISDSISAAGREILRSEGIGYYDSGGSLFLRGSGIFVLIDKPVGKTAERALASAFVGRRALALQAVWSMKRKAFGVNEIARRARVSAATASEAMTVLDRHDWVSSMGSGPSKLRKLINPRAMLDAWSEHQRAAKAPLVRRYFVPVSATAEIVDRLAQACNEEKCLYAITGEVAAQVHAPYLSGVSQVLCRLRSGPATDLVLDRLDARPVRDGWNLGVLEATSDADFALAENINGVWFAGPLQTYLDLLQSGGRSRDMAEHLRAERLEMAI